jgi:signal transduction histidine kinase
MDSRPGDRIAGEQAALRRVASLVASGVPPEEIFAAVTAEVRRLLDADLTSLARFDPDGAMTFVARWSAAGEDRGDDVHMPLGGRNVSTMVSQTGRPARMDDYSEVTGPVTGVIRKFDVRSSVGVPVSVEGRLWGVMIVASTSRDPFPAGTEAQLVGFTELVGAAIANAQARVELRGYAEEQAALRRVATLVASGTSPEEVFAAVAAEAGRLLSADQTGVGRYDPGDVVTVVGAWSGTGTAMPLPVGTRTNLGGRNMATLVFTTRQPVRIDDYGGATGAASGLGRHWGYHAAIAAPIMVQGRLWGVMVVASIRGELSPAGSEARLAGFTELVGAAIANAQARVELRSYAEEQAALRRVATLVARAALPEQVLVTVAEEIGRLLAADFTGMCRYDASGTATVAGMWASTDPPWAVTVGDQLKLGGQNVTTLVFQTGRPARIDDYSDSSGVIAEAARGWGFRSAVGVPIRVAGRLWGVVTAGSARTEGLPPDTEGRLAGFTELAGTAIANAEAQSALAASRARIVTAADEAGRRIERDLHDGAQQRLASLALRLREAQAAAPAEAYDTVLRLDGIAAGLDAALEDLREIARGIHPAALAEGGLRPALAALARRCDIPVSLHVQVADRLPDPVEIAAYYMVCEALTNTARHARASTATVDATAGKEVLRLRVRDDGRGGADFSRGSGLVGLKDRVEALGGRISLHSPPGNGTLLEVHIPVQQDRPPPLTNLPDAPA